MQFGKKQSPYAGALTFAYMNPLERDKYEYQLRQQQSRPPTSIIDPQLANKQWWAKENARRNAALAEAETAAAASYRGFPSGGFQFPEARTQPSIPTFPATSGGNDSRRTGRVGEKTEIQLLQEQLDLAKLKNQLSVQPMLAGIQNRILGNMGSSMGLNMSQYQQPSMFGGAGERNLGWMNTAPAPKFPQAFGYGRGGF
jgi:hypothetical protein